MGCARARVFDVRVLAASPDGSRGDETFRLRPRSPLDGPLFWLTLPARIRREARAFRPDAIVAQSPFEAACRAARAHRRAGDRRAARRLAHLRRASTAPARGVRSRASPTRSARGRCGMPRRCARSRRTPRELARAAGREPAGGLPGVHGPRAVRRRRPCRCPSRPVALFIGVLEPYKNIDGLAEAWRRARSEGRAAHRRQGHAHRCGRRALVRDGLATWQPELSTDGGRARARRGLARSILPSRSEGMGRVVIEAQLRGRPGARLRRRRDPRPRHRRRRRACSSAATPTRCARSACSTIRASCAARRGRARGRRALARLPGGVRGAHARAGRRVRARRDHAARRSRRSGARSDGRRCCVRSLRASTSSSCSTLVARDAGLPGNVACKVIAAPDQALRGARFAAALAPELRRGRWRCSRTCRRSTPCSPRRSSARCASRCCSGSRTGARRGCCGSPSASSTRVLTVDRTLVPARLAEGDRRSGTGST